MLKFVLKPRKSFARDFYMYIRSHQSISYLDLVQVYTTSRVTLFPATRVSRGT